MTLTWNHLGRKIVTKSDVHEQGEQDTWSSRRNRFHFRKSCQIFKPTLQVKSDTNLMGPKIS